MGSSLELNPEQRAAVEHGEGPLLIIAGPGSGKTRVIIQRIVRLLGNAAESGGERPNDSRSAAFVQPDRVLALTYTDKAAGEMQQRVREALPGLETHPTISTFHAFCKQVLEEQTFDQQLLEPVDLWIFLRRRMRELALKHYRKLAEPGAFLHDLNEFFSRCQDELVEPDDFAAYVATLRAGLGPGPVDPLDLLEVEKKEELARVFRRSRELLEAAGCTSFGSLISETLRLWDREPNVLARYRDRFRYVLVDEFQDSNYAQIELLKRLVAPPYNITAVGDDDQAIYRFRGASHGTFEMFDRAFPGHRTVYLNRNYRSTQRILRASQVVIARNEARYRSKPELRTGNAEGPSVYLIESPDDRSEAAWVSDEVERLAKGGSPLGDIAVLYRSHRHRERFVAEFRRREIPFTIRGLSILKTPMVRDLVAYLHLIHSPHHNISLTRVLLAPRWRFPEELARDARRRASVGRSSFYTAIRSMEQTLFATDLHRTGWGELETLLGGVRELARVAPVTALFDRLVERLGLRSLGTGRDHDYLRSFRKFLEEWEKKSETANFGLLEGLNGESRRPLDDFMDYYPYFQEAGGQIEAPDPPDTSRAVQMMTVHAAKGLEFPVVFVLSVGRQRFPTMEKKPVIEFPDALRKGPPAPSGIHLQEERRLFYVALTRARQRLYVSSLAKAGAKPSTFVRDLLSNPVVRPRDIERIQVAAAIPASHSAPSTEAAGKAAAPRVPPQRVLLSERTVDEKGQGMLFPHSDDMVALLHPDLEEWARRPVKGGKEPGQPPVLSATAIETYRNCPLRFKFQHLLKIQTEPQASLTFGAVMHQSIRHYFKLRGSGLARFEDLAQFFLCAWKDTGFQDGYHAEQYQQEGLDELREFVERLNAQPVPSHLASEQSFSLEVHGVRVQGRIDQVQAVTPNTPPQIGPRDGGLLELSHPAPSGASQASLPPGLEVELIDYKTGRPKSQQDADKSLQLSVYALAAQRALGLRPLRLTFYNLSNNQAVSTVRSEKDLEDVVAEICQVADAIHSEQFEPAPGYVCRRCEFASICPTQEEV